MPCCDTTAYERQRFFTYSHSSHSHGSLVERLGKPTIPKTCDTEHLPIKSLLSTDFDVMLTPQTILAAATEDPKTSQAQTLFDVVSLPNTPGFVWLKLNQNYKESSDKFWRDLCVEYTFADGSKGLYLSSFEVRNVFVKGMKRIKRKVTGYFGFYKKIAEKGVAFHVKAQGPAVTVKVERRQNLYGPIRFKSLRPTLFYGDFIFAIKCI
ncbi:uncharacterized protein LOC116299056 isoform X2 [Actinia tenebrosa]|uniref:Uncharacterized protein LOC116299056 isoform X2 n=1 Tax=Actinia tenebrosa TaxID=6105 RepID=A0A6P8I8G1_ACTTE|nr:uncharacterized protein LOC116299056 isoform X2 [Actinia tenebrosa]